MFGARGEEFGKNAKAWMSNPYNAAIVLVALAAFIIRLFFFIKTQGQTLWWDESEYMSAAKSWAFGVPYEYNPQRPPLFQALSALAFMLGLGENFIRMAFVLIPSVALVVAIYYLGREMFNEKIGLIASIFAAVSWTFLFWTARVQPDFFSMLFQVLAVMFMWKHWKKASVKHVCLAAFFAALGFYFKVSALLVPMIFIVFMALKDRLAALKDKHNYYFSAVFLLTLVPYFIWSFLKFGTALAFKKGYVDAPTDFPIGWYNIKFYYIMTDNVMFILLIAAAIAGLRFLIYADLLAKEKGKCFNPDLFSIVCLLFISAFYIFYQRNTDDRWVFLWMPFIFMLAGRTLEKMQQVLSKYHKVLATGTLVIILGISVFSQLSHGAALISERESSYSQVKSAALWMKANSAPGDTIFSISYPQTVYYSERNVLTFSQIPPLTLQTMDGFVNEHKPKYIMYAPAFERYPEFTEEWLTLHQNELKIAHVEYIGQNPVLVVYEVQYS